MNRPSLNDMKRRIKTAQQELDHYLEEVLIEKRKQLHYKIERGKAVFEKNVDRLLRQQRVHSLKYIVAAPIGVILSAPIIYGMIIPLAFLDLTITLYQHICFRIYRIPRVDRATFIVIDRHRLPYLNNIQKLNCIYCGYGNGLIAYAREVIARTEQFWCPIKHTRRVRGEHNRTKHFVDYGDAEAWKEQRIEIRKKWK